MILTELSLIIILKKVPLGQFLRSIHSKEKYIKNISLYIFVLIELIKLIVHNKITILNSLFNLN